MDDLFRFLLLRPANLPAPTELDVLYPDFLGSGSGHQLDGAASTTDPREEAAEYLETGDPLRGVDDLSIATTALAVHAALAAGPIPLADLRTVVATTTATSIENLVAAAGFDLDRSRLANTLVAVKLVSGVPGIDARGLGVAAQAYDALSRAADGADPVPLRPLVLPEGLEGGGSGGSAGNGRGLAARGSAPAVASAVAADPRRRHATRRPPKRRPPYAGSTTRSPRSGASRPRASHPRQRAARNTRPRGVRRPRTPGTPRTTASRPPHPCPPPPSTSNSPGCSPPRRSTRSTPRCARPSKASASTCA